MLRSVLDGLPPADALRKFYISTGNIFVFDIKLIKRYFDTNDPAYDPVYANAARFVIVQGAHKSDESDQFEEGSPSVILGVSTEPTINPKTGKLVVSILQSNNPQNFPLTEHTPQKSIARLQPGIDLFGNTVDLYFEILE